MQSDQSNHHINNIFNKKNVEFSLEEKSNSLPYQSANDVSMKSNQIIFTAVNYSLQKLLDNDLYNEALLKKFINDGQIAGPRYIYDLDVVLNSDVGKKFVLSSPTGISVVRKESDSIESSLEGPYLSGHVINEIDFMEDGGFQVGADNGIWHSTDKRNWLSSNVSEDVIEICYNENYLTQRDSLLSGYQFLAIDSSGGLYGIQLDDVSSKEWHSLKDDPQTSSFCDFRKNTPFKLFSAKDDKLYIGTSNGLYSVYGYPNERPTLEMFSHNWQVNEMLQLNDVEDKRNRYLLGTGSGMKQSQATFMFRNLQWNGELANLVVTSLDCYSEMVVVGTNLGLYKAERDSTEIEKLGLDSICVNAIDHAFRQFFIATLKGLYTVDFTKETLEFKPITSKNSDLLTKSTKVLDVKLVANAMVVIRIGKKDLYYASTSDLDTWIELPDFAEIPNITKVVGMKSFGSNLYIITDYGVYKYVLSDGIPKFMYVDSFLKTSDIPFVKSERNGKSLLFSDGKLYVVKNGISEPDLEISIREMPLDCTVSENETVYVLKQDGTIIKYGRLSNSDAETVYSGDLRFSKISIFETNLDVDYLIGTTDEGSLYAISTVDGNVVELKSGISVTDVFAPFFGYSEDGSNHIGMVEVVEAYSPLESNLNESSLRYFFIKKYFSDPNTSRTHGIELDAILSAEDGSTTASTYTSIFPFTRTYEVANFEVDSSNSLHGFDYIGYARERDSNRSFAIRSDDNGGLQVKTLRREGFLDKTTIDNDFRKFADFYDFDSNNNLSNSFNYAINEYGQLFRLSTEEAAVPLDIQDRVISKLAPMNSVVSAGESIFLIGTDNGVFKLLANDPSETLFYNVDGFTDGKVVLWKDYETENPSFYTLANTSKTLYRTNEIDSELTSLSIEDSEMTVLTSIPSDETVLKIRAINDVETYTLSDRNFFEDEVELTVVGDMAIQSIASIYGNASGLSAETMDSSVFSLAWLNSEHTILTATRIATDLDYSGMPLTDIINDFLSSDIRVTDGLSAKASETETEIIEVPVSGSFSLEDVVDVSVNATTGLDLTMFDFSLADLSSRELDFIARNTPNSLSVDGSVGLTLTVSADSAISSISYKFIASFYGGDQSEPLVVESDTITHHLSGDGSSSESFVSSLTIGTDSLTGSIDSTFSIRCHFVVESIAYRNGVFPFNPQQQSRISFSSDFSNIEISFSGIKTIDLPKMTETNGDGEYDIVPNLVGIYLESLGTKIGFDGSRLTKFSNFIPKARSQRIAFVLTEDEEEEERHLYYAKANDVRLRDRWFADKEVKDMDVAKDFIGVVADGSVFRSKTTNSKDFFNASEYSLSNKSVYKLVGTSSSLYATIRSGSAARLNRFSADSEELITSTGISKFGLYSAGDSAKYLQNGILKSTDGEVADRDLRATIASENESGNVDLLGEFFELANFHNFVYASKNKIYYETQCYNFDAKYQNVTSATQQTNIVDAKRAEFGNPKQQALVLATSDKIFLALDYVGMADLREIYSNLTNVRAICCYKTYAGTDLLVLDGVDLHTFRNFDSVLLDSEKTLSDLNDECILQAIDDSTSETTFYDNHLVVGNRIYSITTSTGIVIAKNVQDVDYPIQNFYSRLNGSIYAITRSDTYLNSSPNVNDWYAMPMLNISSSVDGMSLDRSVVKNDSSAVIGYKTVGLSSDIGYLALNGSVVYGCKPQANGMFVVGHTVYAATTRGIYTLKNPPYGFAKDDMEYEVGKNCTAFEELGGEYSYVLNYTKKLDDEYTTANVVVTNHVELAKHAEDIASNFRSNQIYRIDSMFGNRYIVFSDIGTVAVFDTVRNELHYPNTDQFKYLIDFQADSINAMIQRGNYGIVGYGSHIETFDGFGYGMAFGDVVKQYSLLGNNFRSNVYRIVYTPIDDFMVGTAFGARYAYDNKMTRSFIDRSNHEDSLLWTVKVIETGSSGSGTDKPIYIVGQGSSIYEITDAKNGKFKKVLTLPEGVTVTSLYPIQSGQYVIGTTNGIYLTSAKYRIVDDLHSTTFKTSIDIVNEKLRNVIAKHILDEHGDEKPISKLNKKMASTLPMVSINNVTTDKLRGDIPAGLKHVVNDIVETIEINDEGDDTGYVKVAVKNFATNSNNLQTTNLFGDSGFVSEFVDPTSGKTFNIANPAYICKNWSSGLKEIYIYVPSTATYYLGNPYGMSNSQYAYSSYPRENLGGLETINMLDVACTTLRVYLYNNHFGINTILAAQCVGNSLPLKIYKDYVYADDSWKGLFNAVTQPSTLRTLPTTAPGSGSASNIVSMIDSSGRLVLDFSVCGTDAQAIRIIAES